MPTSIFWPEGSTKSGIAYGFREPAVCVVGVLEQGDWNNTKLRECLGTSSLWNSLRDSCRGDPVILGWCTFTAGKSKVPNGLESYNDTSYVLYTRHAPNSLRFYTLGSSSSTTTNASKAADPFISLAAYDFTRPCISASSNGAIDNTLIDQLNASYIIHHTISQWPLSSPPPLLPVTASFLLQVASHLSLFSKMIVGLSNVATTLLRIPVVPDFKLTAAGLGSDFGEVRYLTLRDFSATVQQLDVRIEQGIFFLTQVSSLQRQDTHDVASYSVRYTNFFNKAWLIMNDMTLGWAAGTFLADNSVWMSEVTTRLIQTILFQFPKEVLYWLDSWPAGLKLNAELSRFYVNTLVGLIDTWESFFPSLPPSLFYHLSWISTLGGLTLLLSLLSDTLSFLLLLHLHISYILTRLLFSLVALHFPLSLLLGLFRGKRMNPLRETHLAMERWEWDMDQLLFGTLIFMLMCFVWPTVGVYYGFFALARLGGVVVRACLEVGVVFLRTFPLFEGMLWGKDGERVPGGVCFKAVRATGRHGESWCIRLESQPVPMSAIFYQYNELRTRLTRHYHPLGLIYRVLKGEHLGTIPIVEMKYDGERTVDVGGGGGRKPA